MGLNILDQALELESRGLAVVFQKGRKAFQPGWNKERKSADSIKADYRDGYNLGVVTGLSQIDGKKLCIVDLDIRSKEPAHIQAAWTALQSILGKSNPTTKTGGGGAHWWVWVSAEGFPGENKLVLAQSQEKGEEDKLAWTIELLTNGHACTVPPSVH